MNHVLRKHATAGALRLVTKVPIGMRCLILDSLIELLDVASPTVEIGEIEAFAREHFGIDARALPLTGERDRNFHLQDRENNHFVLKVIHSAEPSEVTDLQSRLLMHIGATAPDLPVPRLVRPKQTESLECIWNSEGHSTRRIRCLTYLQGRPLYRTTGSALQRRHLGACLAQLDLALNDFRHTADSHDLIWDLKSAVRVRPFLSELTDQHKRELAEAALDRFSRHAVPCLPQLRHQVIHNDFNPHNVLVDENADDIIAGIIDFGDVVRSPLIQDLAVASAYQLGVETHPLQGAADMAIGFNAILPMLSDEIDVLPDMIGARLALTIAVSSRNAMRHPENADYLLRNQGAAWSGLQRLHDIPRGDAILWLRREIGAG